MAAIQDTINALTGTDEKAQQEKERLELLKNAAEAHLQIARDRITEELLGNAGGIYQLYIVPDTVIGFEEGYTISSGETIDKGVETAVDKFFQGDVKEGFKAIVKSALSDLFADTTAGESQKDFYFVTMEHNAFIRVDLFIWKYYFDQKSIQENVQQAFCYTFCKSVIDHTKVHLDTLIYLISAHMGDDLNKVKDYISQMKALYDELGSQDHRAIAERETVRLRG